MNGKSHNKPLVILVVGLPGAGKSFFAKRFSETFGAPVVSYDRIRFEINPEFEMSVEKEGAVHRLARYQIEELLKTKRSIIIDGGANTRADRLTLTQLAKKAQYNSLVIWVQTDVATCQQRALRRNPTKPDDRFNLSLSQEVFAKHTKNFSAPTIHETSVVISGKHTYSTQARTILKKIAAPREQTAITISDRSARPIDPPSSAPPRRNVTIN